MSVWFLRLLLTISHLFYITSIWQQQRKNKKCATDIRTNTIGTNSSNITTSCVKCTSNLWLGVTNLLQNAHIHYIKKVIWNRIRIHINAVTFVKQLMSYNHYYDGTKWYEIVSILMLLHLWNSVWVTIIIMTVQFFLQLQNCIKTIKATHWLDWHLGLLEGPIAIIIRKLQVDKAMGYYCKTLHIAMSQQSRQSQSLQQKLLGNFAQ